MAVSASRCLFVFLVFIGNVFVKLFLIDADHVQRPRINLTNGEIEGLLFESKTGRKANVFWAIPYAEPPIGQLRFSKTVPKKPWDEMLQCNRGYAPACPQNISISQFANQSEDCLYVNVFASLECTPESPCPVLYYVHGGANEFETPSMFPDEDLVDNFASKGIVLVTVAYRLGILGFYSTGTADVPGNWAVQDILEGLRWVRNEIELFGGDPSNLTIMGLSSSATIISLLTMNPNMTGMFSRAITMSGSGVAWNAIDNNVTHYRRLSQDLGCWPLSNQSSLDDNFIEEVLKCMRAVDPHVMINRFNALRGLDKTGVLPRYLSSVRNDGPDGLFPLPLRQMIAQRPKKISLMTGLTKYEGGWNKMGLIRAKPGDIVKSCVEQVQQDFTIENKRKVSLACILEYMFHNHSPEPAIGRESPFSFWTNQAVSVEEDADYYAPLSLEVASVLNNESDYGRHAAERVFIYSFDYEKPELAGMYPWHAADASYLFGSHKLHGVLTDTDLAVRDRYVPLFLNFVKHGHPTPEPVDGTLWQPANGHPQGSYPYLSVSLSLTMRRNYRQRANLFWNKIVPEMDNNATNESRNEENVLRLSKSSPEVADALQELLNISTNATSNVSMTFDDASNFTDFYQQKISQPPPSDGTHQVAFSGKTAIWVFAMTVTLSALTICILAVMHRIRKNGRRISNQPGVDDHMTPLLAPMQQYGSYSGGHL